MPRAGAIREEMRLFEQRLALVSVLQELTVAALELFDPRASADAFLERMAERLGCYAALLVALDDQRAPTLHGATGLSPASRRMAIPAAARRALLDTAADVGHGLPYPELARGGLTEWRFSTSTPPGSSLLLFFEGDPGIPVRYRGMLRRLAGVLATVLQHRQLFARTIESERRLRERGAILECMSEASPDGVLFVDAAGAVILFNRRFVEMWGLDRPHDTHRPDDVLAAIAAKLEDPDEFLGQSPSLLERADAATHDELHLRDGRIVERHARRVTSSEGVLYGFAIFYRDTTARRRAEAEREALLDTERAARQTAEEAIRARDDFLSVASHELRTPLTALLLAVEQVLRGARRFEPSIPPSILRALEAAQRQTQRLVHLVDALLDVSKIRAGRLRLELEQVDLCEIVHEVVARFQGEPAGRQIAFRCDGPVIGRWDRSRLDQVATNLLANALKYGRGNAIDVTVDGDDARARLEVRDRGIGIPSEQIGRLFQRFERAVSSRQYGGLGLGLYIVRQIVEMHGGEVYVDSEPEVGSTFTVVLPRTPRP